METGETAETAETVAAMMRGWMTEGMAGMTEWIMMAGDITAVTTGIMDTITIAT
jgi:hypothetical protein